MGFAVIRSSRWQSTTIFSALLIALLICACKHTEPPIGPYVTYDSGLVSNIDFSSPGGGHVFWYDKDTLIVRGNIKPESNPATSIYQERLYVWRPPDPPHAFAPNLWPDTANGFPPPLPYTCARQGVLTFSRGPPHVVMSKPGRPGSETWDVYTGSLEHLRESKVVRAGYNRIAGATWAPCDPGLFSSAPYDFVWTASYDEKYILAAHPKNHVLYSPMSVTVRDRSGKILSSPDIPKADFNLSCTFSTPWEPSFIQWDCVTLGGNYLEKHPNGLSIWRITPDTAPQQTRVSFAPFGSENLEKFAEDLFYTRQGYFLTIRVPPGQYLPDMHFTEDFTSGLYQVRGSRLVRVAPRFFKLGAVSPDGCKVALYVMRYASMLGGVSVIDVCQLAPSASR